MFYNLRRKIRQQISRSQRSRTQTEPESETQFQGTCPCCGSLNFKQIDILWDDLTDAWGLDQREIKYINRQQGFRCVDCGARLRSMALAEWLLHRLSIERPLASIFSNEKVRPRLDLLEVNEAGQLTPYLQKFDGHVLAQYPEVDMQDLPYEDNSFDVVIHSDTLEHVPDPIRALSECCRVLKDGGACVFTVPVIVDRLTRSTLNSLASYHGHSKMKDEGLRVRTEFGADLWRTVIRAGFDEYCIYPFEYPAALVHIGVKRTKVV